MFCLKCGNKLLEGALFCNKCGASIETVNNVLYGANNTTASVNAPDSNTPLGEKDAIGMPNTGDSFGNAPFGNQNFNYQQPGFSQDNSSQGGYNQQAGAVPPVNQNLYYSGQTAFQNTLATNNISPKKSKKKLIIIIACIVVLIAAAVVATLLLLGGKKDKNADNDGAGGNSEKLMDADIEALTSIIQMANNIAADVEYSVEPGDQFVITIKNGKAKLSVESGNDDIIDAWEEGCELKHGKYEFQSEEFAEAQNTYVGRVQNDGNVEWYYDEKDELFSHSKEFKRLFEGEYDQNSVSSAPIAKPESYPESGPESAPETYPESGPESAPESYPESGPESAPESIYPIGADYSSGGNVLNIYCFSDEFANRLMSYPGYEPFDATDSLSGGMIGSVIVKFNFVPNIDMDYINALDKNLASNIDKAADERVDLFILEPDDLAKYINSENTLDVVNALGIDESTFDNQYNYVLEQGTNSSNELKAVAWNACPGVMLYNKEIAREVLGTDDPEAIQSLVGDWESYNNLAVMMVSAGYAMQASPEDTYRSYANGATSPWVVDGYINVDPVYKKWADDSKELYAMNGTMGRDFWEELTNISYGGAFCTFGPAWLINFCMCYDTYIGDESIANKGEWGACEGPDAHAWGGSFMVAARGTDNADIVADIMAKLSGDVDTMRNIAYNYGDFVNNTVIMDEMTYDGYYIDIFGGYDPTSVYSANAKKVNGKYLTEYDITCNEAFRAQMLPYITGEASYEECLENFYLAVNAKCSLDY